MSYELRIGWRYIYRGRQSWRPIIGLLVSLGLIGLGFTLLFTADGGSTLGVAALAAGMFGAVLFFLLLFFSVFTTVSVLGVVLGVAALTVVLAVTTGFQQQFREKVLGVNAHVIVMKNTNDFKNYEYVEQLAMEIDSDVVAVQPFIFVEMLVTRGKGELSGVAIKGVDPKRVSQVLDLEKHMLDNATVQSLEEERVGTKLAPIILGRELAHKLKAKVGDKVTVVAPLSNVDFETWTAKGDAPKTRDFRISGIFYSGFDEYDRRLMYISLKEAQELLGHRDQVMGVELKVKDVDRAKDIADKLEKALGGSPFVVQDWHELNRNLFTALTLQKIALLIILTLIIVVATFNMVSALTMMVIDKTREIAIIKSMGGTSPSIGRVFQVVGIFIGGVGTFFGLTIGLTICWTVGDYGYHLDPKVYLIDRLPISVDPYEVLLVAGITMLISAVATLFPSAKASSLRPVEGLRYD
ncbi:MAG TPA: ABC transporter permease [Kofleriaceae bacterium]|nr:ABC transporter permease [Kofleriaceae bacterium]